MYMVETQIETSSIKPKMKELAEIFLETGKLDSIAATNVKEFGLFLAFISCKGGRTLWNHSAARISSVPRFVIAEDIVVPLTLETILDLHAIKLTVHKDTKDYSLENGDLPRYKGRRITRIECISGYDPSMIVYFEPQPLNDRGRFKIPFTLYSNRATYS